MGACGVYLGDVRPVDIALAGAYLAGGRGSPWSLPNRPRRRAPEGGDESFSLGGGPSQMRRSVIRRDGEKHDLRAEWRRLGYAAWFFIACVLVVVLLVVVGLYH